MLFQWLATAFTPYDVDDDAETDTTERVLDFDECIGINTILINGTCHCMNTFIFGDPNSKQGCWKCIFQCLPNARCGFPGKCICENGLVGDGINSCHFPEPILLAVNLGQYSTKGGQNISLTFYTEHKIVGTEMYCKFGNTTLPAVSVKSNQCTCQTPKMEQPGIVQLSISFDEKNWSPKPAFVEFVQPPAEFSIHWSIFIIIAMIIIIAILVFMRKRNDSPMSVEVIESRLDDIAAKAQIKNQSRQPI